MHKETPITIENKSHSDIYFNGKRQPQIEVENFYENDRIICQIVRYPGAEIVEHFDENQELHGIKSQFDENGASIGYYIHGAFNEKITGQIIDYIDTIALLEKVVCSKSIGVRNKDKNPIQTFNRWVWAASQKFCA